MRRLAVVAVVVAVLPGLMSCAPTGAPGPGGDPTSGAATTDPAGTGPAATAGPTGSRKPEVTQPAKPEPSGAKPDPTGVSKEITITGTVVMHDVDGGCLVLEGYELVGGDPAVIAVGRRVTVTGWIATDLASICQAGPILMVTSAKLA